MALFRANVERLRDDRAWFQKDLAAAAGISASMLSRSANGMTLWGALAIAKALEVGLAELVTDTSAPSARTSDLAAHAKKRQLQAHAARLYLAESVVPLLADDGARSDVEGWILRKPELPEKVVSAAWGVVHVKNVPFETAIQRAREIYDGMAPEERDGMTANAKWFLDRIVERLGEHPDKGSGTYPSVVRRQASSAPPVRSRK
jgi:transcriptional regulator with XRE-family HTH domain